MIILVDSLVFCLISHKMLYPDVISGKREACAEQPKDAGEHSAKATCVDRIYPSA